MDIKINEEKIISLKKWFTNYANHFKYDGYAWQRNIDLKINHTKRVCKEIVNLGTQLELDENERRLAEIIALFHDIGRFEQYARYKSFVDRKSENHAELGVRILESSNVLNDFDESIKSLILRTILYHNRVALPANETEPCLFFTKLLRDADKLDIWKVVTDYYYQQNGERNGAIELDLPDTLTFSTAVYQDVMNEKIVDMKHVNNLNDFKLLQMAWVFDINFKPTYQLIQTRRYVELIANVLPKTEAIQEMVNIIQGYLKSETSNMRRETKYYDKFS